MRKIRACRMQRLLADLGKKLDLLQILHFGGRAYTEAKLLMRVMQTCGTCVDFVLFVRWSRSQWVSAKHSKPYVSFRIREAKKSPYGKNKFGGQWHGDCNVVCCRRWIASLKSIVRLTSSPPPVARDARSLRKHHGSMANRSSTVGRWRDPKT